MTDYQTWGDDYDRNDSYWSSYDFYQEWCSIFEQIPVMTRRYLIRVVDRGAVTLGGLLAAEKNHRAMMEKEYATLRGHWLAAFALFIAIAALTIVAAFTARSIAVDICVGLPCAMVGKVLMDNALWMRSWKPREIVYGPDAC